MSKKTKSPEGRRDVQLKFHVTKPFKDLVMQFNDEHRELGSLGDFGLVAFRFFMQKYTESGFHRDREGFPVLGHEHKEADRVESHGKPRPVHRSGHG